MIEKDSKRDSVFKWMFCHNSFLKTPPIKMDCISCLHSVTASKRETFNKLCRDVLSETHWNCVLCSPYLRYWLSYFLSLSRKLRWNLKIDATCNLSSWAQFLQKNFDKNIILTFHNTFIFVWHTQNCVESRWLLRPWHVSFNFLFSSKFILQNPALIIKK